MRIVGGSWRGRALSAPRGKDVTRPTTDRMRESIASMVESAFDLDLSGVRVLDAFAGSGALGLEFLSRGAASCCFVELNRSSAQCVQNNIAVLGAPRSQAQLVSDDVYKRSARGSLPLGPYKLVLLDPPYAYGNERCAELLGLLKDNKLLALDSVVLYEHDAKTVVDMGPGWRILRQKQHGVTGISLLRWEGSYDA